MKFRLVEAFELHFNKTIELEYDANELADEDDKGKASGTVTEYIASNDILECMWDFMTEDKVNPPLTDKEFDLLSEDDEAYERFVKDNFDMLFKKYEQEFYDKFEEDARERLYNNWDRYSDEKMFSQREEDERSYWDMVSKAFK